MQSKRYDSNEMVSIMKIAILQVILFVFSPSYDEDMLIDALLTGTLKLLVIYLSLYRILKWRPLMQAETE